MSSMLTLLPLLLTLKILHAASESSSPTAVPFGSSLYPTTNPRSWLSPSGRFAFGFYQEGSGFAIGIWLIANSTVVWTANRDEGPIPREAELKLTKVGLKLLLPMPRGDQPISNVSGDASTAMMLDSGNFVIYDSSSSMIWQTFDYPTDTIMAGQMLPAGKELISSISGTNHSSGRFRIKMQNDGNLVMYPVETPDIAADAYWAADTRGKGFQSFNIDVHGNMCLLRNNHSYTLQSIESPSNKSWIYFARLDPDGSFRLYSLEGTTMELQIEIPGVPECQIRGICGLNSYCTSAVGRFNCTCLPGFDYIDSNRTYIGCQRNFIDEGCWINKHNMTYSMEAVENVTWSDDTYTDPLSEVTGEDCQTACLRDCDCHAALFESRTCKKQKLPLKYGIKTNDPSIAFFKVGTGGPMAAPNATIQKGLSIKILVVCVVLVGGLPIASAPLVFFVCRRRVGRYRKLWQGREIALAEEMAPRSFSYHELREATDGFKEELGKGAFGTVFKGTLFSGERIIAVKRLDKVVQEGEREFQTEMKVIGRTHHKNLVRLLGFCHEGSKRLLVYEYMRNGSLADLIFNARVRPHWNERLRIALDVARGIHYLHEECESRIIHCDIKPQNILMDADWGAKISDFGLAKLLMPSQSRTLTGMRGTSAYLAPEWQKNAPITVKVDVYSFGIVLLELICCRRNVELAVEVDEIVLAQWIYKCLSARELENILKGEEVELLELERSVKVGLWCIQVEPTFRPSMKDVLMMLEGNMDVSLPPPPC